MIMNPKYTTLHFGCVLDTFNFRFDAMCAAINVLWFYVDFELEAVLLLYLQLNNLLYFDSFITYI